MKDNTDNIRLSEQHPFEPFMPSGARILMLGTFPPKRSRWSMEFYYPNFQNDMWRIMGLIFFGDKEHFVMAGVKRFDEHAVRSFCASRGIALSDTAVEAVRMKDNASDQFLEVVKPLDAGALLGGLPECIAVVATGQKAAETFAGVVGCEPPAVGEWTPFAIGERALKLYRMPSSSRAYPLALEKKAEVYGRMFAAEGLL